MANLSNINNYFVVDTAGQIAIGDVSSATLPTLQTQLTVYDHTGTAGVIIQSGGASGKKYELFSNASGTFGISDIGVGDRLTISSGGDATFAGNVGVAGKTPTYGLTLAQGTAVGSKIAWTDATPSFRASIYANSSNDKFTIATGNASSVETTALEIDTSQNATFASNVDSQGYTIDAAALQTFQDFQSKPIDTNSGLFTVGGNGMQMGYSRAISMWSSTDGVWNSWVGTNLRWDGTNFKRASDNGGQNWGNIAGIRFLGKNNQAHQVESRL